METPEYTALAIAFLMHRSQQTRGRISEKAVKSIAIRDHLTPSFVERVRADLEEFGYSMVLLDCGGYGLYKIRALEGAKTLNCELNMDDRTMVRTGAFLPEEKF